MKEKKQKMSKEEAIEYLKDKDRLESEKYLKKDKPSEKELIAEDEEEIRKVMKSGKIYGDPIAEVQW